MMRRTVLRATGLAGNGIIGIRREDKNVWERRVPLNPSQVGELLKRGKVKKVIVQPSTIRCYDDNAYAEAGAEVNEDLSEASTIIAVKEVPPQLLIPNRTYTFFSHTIKAQSHNMPLLDTMLQKNIRLVDYEKIVNNEGRMVKFGPYAGFGGMIDTLHSLGLALLTRGYATPFLHLSLSKEYSSLEVARADMREVGEQIRTRGLPKEVCPLTIAVTGSGSVSNAAQQILHHLPCKYIEASDLPKVWNAENKDTRNIYVVVVRARDMVAHKDPTKHFDKHDYYKNPENYVPIFHQTIAPYTRVLINGMYWEPRFPRLLTTAQAKELHAEGRLPLVCLGDITCDIGGSVEFFVKATTIQNPLYAYNLDTETTSEMHEYNGEGILVFGVDHIPAEFPKDASTDFGRGLVPLVERLSLSDGTADLDAQKASLGPELFGAVVTDKGHLTPNFQYIATERAKNEAAEASLDQKHRVLVFGAGMTSGPCVEHLLKGDNQVTVVDSSQASLDALQLHYGGPSRGDVKGLRTAVADCSAVDQYIESLIKGSDCVVSLLPAHMHTKIAECTIQHKVPLVTASYVTPDMAALGKKAADANTVIVPEMGLDPGIDIMTTAEMLHSIRQQGGEVKSYVSLCGALIAPENSDCPLGYKFSWSPRGVLTAATRPTTFMAGGKWHTVDGRFLYHLIQPINDFKGMNLNWVPNGDSSKYVKSYGLDGVDTLIRGTYRYDTFAPAALAFAELGLLNDSKAYDNLKTGCGVTTTWRELIASVVGCSVENVEKATMDLVRERVGAVRAEVRKTEAYAALSSLRLSKDPLPKAEKPFELEVLEVEASFRRLGLFSGAAVPKTANGFIIDSLCATLISQLTFHNHERDFNIMQHRVTAYFAKENKTRVFESTLACRGEDARRTATAVTVGVPAAASAQLILDGGLRKKSGIVSPTDADIYRPVLKIIEGRGIKMHENVYEIPNAKQ